MCNMIGNSIACFNVCSQMKYLIFSIKFSCSRIFSVISQVETWVSMLLVLISGKTICIFQVSRLAYMYYPLSFLGAGYLASHLGRNFSFKFWFQSQVKLLYSVMYISGFNISILYYYIYTQIFCIIIIISFSTHSVSIKLITIARSLYTCIQQII